MSSDMPNVAIRVNSVSKNFILPHQRANSVKSIFINPLRRRKGVRNEVQHALRDVSFEIKEGDFFGIVGRNGSGKSTMLKMLAGIYQPTKGTIETKGRLVPFIELGVGFNPELTGRENVYLNGSLLGFSGSEVDKKYKDIVDFAELERFMDQKLKNYSSGMQVRLAFSVATQLTDSDILIIDEVLAVGDEAFQRKCYEYFGELKRNNKTVVLVTHDMSAVEQFCTRAILIEGGRITESGSKSDVAQAYKELFIEDIERSESDGNKSDQNDGIKDTILSNFEIKATQNGKPRKAVLARMPFCLEASITLKADIEKAGMGVHIVNSRGDIVMAEGFGGRSESNKSLSKGRNVVKFYIEENILTNDTYHLNVAIEKKNKNNVGALIYQSTELSKFTVSGIKNRDFALTKPKVDITVEN